VRRIAADFARLRPQLPHAIAQVQMAALAASARERPLLRSPRPPALPGKLCALDHILVTTAR
jgi:hypothetical protein